MATGCYDTFRAAADAATRSDSGVLRAKLETRYAATLAGLVKELDIGIDPYQPGVREALFEANSPAFAEFLSTGGLAARLASVKDDGDLVEEAFLRVLARLPAPEEAGRIRGYLQERIDRRVPACEQIVWALVTSTEFRFNH